MDEEISKYLQLHEKYLKEARQLVEKKDYTQASEKLWGTVVEIVKAVAAKKHVTLGTHRSIAEFVRMLEREHPELQLRMPFYYANSLHINFYEDNMPPEDVVDGLQIVSELAAELKRLTM